MKSWLLFLTLWGGALGAHIIERDSLVDLRVPQGSSVFFDVDDTLIYYPYHLGRDQWFKETWEATDGDRKAIEDFHRLAGLLAEHLDVAPVDPENRDVIRRLQKQGCEVLAITARQKIHPGIDNWMEKTHSQVQSVGIDLPILFTDRGPKGPVILAQSPSLVVLIDDRLSELQEVEETLLDAGIPFLGIHYRVMEKVPYDPEIAALELCALMEEALGEVGEGAAPLASGTDLVP